MNTILQCRNLSFTYGGSHEPSLSHLDLSLSDGQIVGLMGPNGSGKTTLIKIICGLLNRYEGDLIIDNHVGTDPHTKSILSYLPDAMYMNPNASVRQIISFFADLYPDFDKAKMENFLITFKIAPNAKIKTLSKGNKEKVQLGLVLSRNARIYILDEPIGGVDPASRDFILHSILQSYAKSALLLISTHLIDDIEEICDSVIFLKEGKMVRFGSRKQLMEENGKTINELFKEDFRCF